MSFLDLYPEQDARESKFQPGEGARLPSEFGENIQAAWSDGRMFSLSMDRAVSRAAALGDYVDEIRQKTGQDLSKVFIPDVAGGGQTGVTDFTQANERVAALKQDHPDLDVAPLDDAEIDRRALAKAQTAHRTYETLQAGEKTWGGSFGSFLGSAGAAATDPINIVGLAVAPEAGGVSILSAALRWGAIAGVSQAAIEGASDQFKEQVQPGYMESGQPLQEIGGAFVGGAVLGGATKALGNAWTRVKTGAWPTSVRDAGNVIESAAHTAQTNPFPGVEGEVAHQEALVKTIDDILAGRPVDVSAQITPDLLRSAAEAEQAKAVPDLTPTTEMKQAELPLGLPDKSPAELNLLHGFSADRGFSGFKPLDQVDDAARYDGGNGVFGNATYLDATGKWINGDNGPLGIDAAVRVKAKFDNLFVLTPDNAAELERAIGKDALHSGDDIAAALKAKGFDGIQVKGFDDLSIQQKDRFLSHFGTKKIEGDEYPNFDTAVMQDQVVAFRPEKSLRVAGKVGLPPKPPIEATEIDRENYFRTRSLAVEGERDFLSGPKSVPPDIALQPPLQTAEDIAKTLSSPDHQDAIRADIDRARALKDVQVPGIDENGNHTMIGVDKAMDEVDAYKAAAEQIQACANPAQEEETQPLKREVTSRSRTGRPMTSKKIPELNPNDVEDAMYAAEDRRAAARLEEAMRSPVEETASPMEGMSDSEAGNFFEQQLRAAAEERGE